MNIDIEEVRGQMLELHRRELEGLEVFAGALERARQFGLAQPVAARIGAMFPKEVPCPTAKAPARRGPKPSQKAAAKEPASPPRTNRKGRRGAVLVLFEAVVSDMAEPFTVASAKEAFLKAHPEQKDWTLNIAGALMRWHDAGLLERTAGGGTGNPSSYRRTKNWAAAEGDRSPKERAYMDFRSSITPAKTDEA